MLEIPPHPLTIDMRARLLAEDVHRLRHVAKKMRNALETREGVSEMVATHCWWLSLDGLHGEGSCSRVVGLGRLVVGAVGGRRVIAEREGGARGGGGVGDIVTLSARMEYFHHVVLGYQGSVVDDINDAEDYGKFEIEVAKCKLLRVKDRARRTVSNSHCAAHILHRSPWRRRISRWRQKVCRVWGIRFGMTMPALALLKVVGMALLLMLKWRVKF